MSRQFVLLALAILLCLPLGAGAQERDTFIYVRPLEIISLDPATVTESLSGFVLRNVYSRLVDTAYDGSSVEPDLAHSWTISDDGLTYDFELREGVLFQDGSALQASDVVYSFERLLAIGEGDAASLAPWIASVEATGDLSVRFTLTEPFSAFILLLGYPRGSSIVSEAWVSANATEEDPWATEFMATNMMGTGPYRFVEWVQGEFARIERFDDYYGGPAPIREVISLINKDDTATRLSLEAGEIDAVPQLPYDIVEALADNPDIAIHRRATGQATFWSFNLTIPPFDDARVRQAIIAAMDYDGLMENLVGDSGVRMNTPVFASMPYHDADYPLPMQDQERARALLAEAGYADGLEIELIYVDWRILKQIVVVIQSSLAEVGITAELVEQPFGPFLENIGNDVTGIYPWVSGPDYPQAISVLERFHSEAITPGDFDGNISRYQDEEYDALLAAFRATDDAAEQEALAHQMQAKLMEDAVWMMLYQEQETQVTRANIEGYDFGVYNYLDMRDVRYSSE